MSRRSIMFKKKIRQMLLKGGNVDLLIPSITAKGDGTKFRGGKHPDAVSKGNAGQICSLPMGHTKEKNFRAIVAKMR